MNRYLKMLMFKLKFRFRMRRIRKSHKKVRKNLDDIAIRLNILEKRISLVENENNIKGSHL